MNREYWNMRIAYYQEQADHIREMRAKQIDHREKRRLTKELERIFLEIATIKESLK